MNERECMESSDERCVPCAMTAFAWQRGELSYPVDGGEAGVKAILRERLPAWFHVREEVCGVHPEGERLRLDFCCFPRDHLIDRGFEPVAFGIETKKPRLYMQGAMNVARQAHLYTEAEYRVPNRGPFRVAFVCVCPSFAGMLAGRYYSKCLPIYLARFAAKMHVGEFVLEVGGGFAIYFHHSHRYFDARGGASGANPRITVRRVSR